MKIRHSVLAWAGGLWLATVAGLPAQSHTFSTPAGNPFAIGLDGNGYPIGGYADGTNQGALFNFPQAVAPDSAGNVFVADTLNNAIRKMTRVGGDWVVTTVAGGGPTSSGANDGVGSAAQFNFPYGVAVDQVGNLYVADMFNCAIRKVTRVGNDWMVTTIAGLAAVSGPDDGPGSIARFTFPTSVAVDGATNVYVADCNAQTIRKLSPAGTNWMVTTVAGAYGQTGSADGTNDQARFNSPGSIALDTAGRIYVSDCLNSTVRRITPLSTNYVVTTLAGQAGHSGSVDGTGSAARFWNPLGGIGADNAGTLYVTDNGMIRKITPVGTNWVVTTIAGSPGATGWVDGTGSSVRFFWPQAVAPDTAGNLYVADSNNNAIRRGALPPATRPSLQLTRQGNQVILSWPVSAVDFELETANILPNGPSWSPVTTGVVVSGDNFVLTNSPGAAKAMYRLRWW